MYFVYLILKKNKNKYISYVGYTNNIKNNLNVCSELILISRIIQKRIRENQGIKTQKNPFIDHELKEILEEIKKVH